MWNKIIIYFGLVIGMGLSIVSQTGSSTAISSTDADQEEISRQTATTQSPSFRRIRSTDTTAASILSTTQLAPGQCGIVDRIETIEADSEQADAFLAGTAALPYGRRDKKLFYADVAAASRSGYFPPQQNIAAPMYYTVGLLVDGDGYHTVIQVAAPQFKVGDRVSVNADGLLERADCKAKKPKNQ